MSDNDDKSTLKKTVNVLEPVLYWFRLPKPGEDHDDDIWGHHPVFNQGWVKIKNRLEWYESPHIVEIYEDHKKIFDINMGINQPTENFYFEHVDKGGFRSQLESTGELPSGLGEFKIHSRIRTQTPPSGDNNFGLVEYSVTLSVEYSAPEGVKWLPRILARPLNNFFKWAYVQYVAEELLHHDGEYAQEKLNEYFQYLRKYHGEEPLQSKTRQELYEPPTEEGTFFE